MIDERACTWRRLFFQNEVAVEQSAAGPGEGHAADDKSLFTRFHHVQRQRLHHLFETSKFACASHMSAASAHQ